jgi:hypothetical protein
MDAIEKIENKMNILEKDKISKINLQEFEKVKGFVIKYVIDRSSK